MVQNTYNYYWTRENVNRQLEEKISKAYQITYETHKKHNTNMRLAAYMVAVSRVAEAMKLRGWVS